MGAAAFLALLIGLPFGVVALVLALVLSQNRRNSRRQAQLAAWAGHNNLTYLPAVPSLANYWPGPPFTGGWGAQALDVMTGQTPRGRQFCFFTYQYIVSTGKSTTVIRIGVTALRLPAALPRLMLTHETAGTKIARFFGGQDITLESDDFNRYYRVQSDDQRFAYGVLHPRAMEWLLGPGRILAPWRIAGADLICWHGGEPNYAWLFPQLGLMDALVDQIPAQVWADYGRKAAP